MTTLNDAHRLLETILAAAGNKLATAVERLGYPNGNRDAVIPENNILIHVANELARGGFDLYCEAALSDADAGLSARRIDLIAANDELSIAFEFKRRARPESVLADLQRLDEFVVRPATRVDGSRSSSYSNARQALAAFVTTSYGVSEEKWLALQNADADLPQNWSSVRDFVVDRKAVVKRTEAFWESNKHFAATGELRLAWIAFAK